MSKWHLLIINLKNNFAQKEISMHGQISNITKHKLNICFSLSLFRSPETEEAVEAEEPMDEDQEK